MKQIECRGKNLNRYRYSSELICPDKGVLSSIKDQDTVRQCLKDNLLVLRKKRALTQSDVADYMGVSYQQIQKYERGLNRISAENLYRLSRLYGVCMEHFFIQEGL